MKHKGYLMIVIIVLVLNLIGCSSPGQLGDEKLDGFLEEEQVVDSFSEFAPDFTSLLTGDIENLTGKAEENLYTQVSMIIDIESAGENVILAENGSDFAVNINVESIQRSDFINLFTSVEGEEIPEELFSVWEEIQYLLNQYIEDIKIYYGNHRFDQSENIDDDTNDNIINLIVVNNNIASITTNMEMKINNILYNGHLKAEFIKSDELWRITNIEINLAEIESITLEVDPSILNLEKEETSALNVSVYPEGGELSFTSDDEEVATVDETGLVTAVGVGGTVITITANCEGYDQKAVEVEVVVTEAEIEFAGGDGSAPNPYLVETAVQLNNVRNHLDKHFEQIADIDLSEFSENQGWNPIGSEQSPFTGSYNGENFEINNLYLNRPGSDYQGLFGHTGDNVLLRNIILVAVDITGNTYVGGLVGRQGIQFESGDDWIENCRVSGSVYGTSTSTYGYIGGLVGMNYYGTITNCQSSVNVTSEGSRVGGLVGHSSPGGTIEDCLATGDVEGADCVGGLAGSNAQRISYCYATGKVTGDMRAGGLVGSNFSAGRIKESYATGNVTAHSANAGGLAGTNSAVIENCYANGSVSCPGERAGGLTGSNTKTITNSYAVGSVSGGELTGGLVGSRETGGTYGTVASSYYDEDTTGQEDNGIGYPRSTAEMKQKSTFQGWDFDQVWAIQEELSYPYLKF